MSFNPSAGATSLSPPGIGAGSATGIDRVPPAHSGTPPVTLRPVRVLVADGEALVRAGLRALLESDNRIVVVGEAATGDQAVALAGRAQPDVAFVDTEVSGLEGVEATARILSELGVAVMLLTTSEGDDHNFGALRAGASGMLLKDTEPAELGRAAHALARGEAVLSSSLTRLLIAELASRPEPACPSHELIDELTAREREVVALVALGLTNHEIAERLVITPATAKTHVSRAMVKLHAHDRAKLVVFAYETGLVVAGTGEARQPCTLMSPGF
jgi:DNA-binding NarL/FixJ family response regulator